MTHPVYGYFYRSNLRVHSHPGVNEIDFAS